MKLHPRSSKLRMSRNLRGLFCNGTAIAVVAIITIGAQVLPAQTEAPSRERPIELSPFVVSTDQDVGYLAGNTLAGSRLNTKLKDTPAAISVLTTEFLSDIGAFDISEAMAYAVNVEFDIDDGRSASPNGNSTVGGYQNFRVRGLNATVARNYFRWGVPAESALVERIEDSRGPNAVLFGIASAGGLINAMTKQAHVGRDFQRASFSVMSYDSYRGTLDINQPLLDGKLAFRLNGVYNKTNTFRHWQYSEHKRGHLAATYVLSDRTRIRAEYERGTIEDNRPRNEPLKDSVRNWLAAGRPTFGTPISDESLGVSKHSSNVNLNRWTYFSNTDQTLSMRNTMTSRPFLTANEPLLDPNISDFSVNIGGPDQDRVSRFDTFSAFLEHQFSDTTFMEVAYNHQDHYFERYDPRTDSPQRLKGDPNEFLPDGTPNPFAGQLYLEGGWYQITSRDQSDTLRATLSTEIDAGKFGNYRIAGMGEYAKEFRESWVRHETWYDAETGLPARHQFPSHPWNRTYRRTYVTEGDWASYHITGPGRRGGLLTGVFDPVTGRTLSSDWTVQHGNVGETYTDLITGMLAVQGRYFDNRLVLAAGYRRDSLERYNVGTMRDPVTNQWVIARDDADATNRLSRTDTVGKTETLGFVYHVTPWLSVHYNQSDNISLPASQFRLPDSGEPGNPIPVESPRGETQDYGFALTLLDGKLYARATYYETGFVRQSTTSPSPVRAANQRIMEALFDEGLVTQEEVDFRTDVGVHGLFDHSTEGLELEVTANVTDNWRVRVTYAHTDTVQENQFLEWRNWHELNLQYLSQFDIDNIKVNDQRTIAEDIDFYLTTPNGLNQFILNEGESKHGNRKHKLNLFTRYNFSSGFLRGFYVGGGYRYQSRMFTGLKSEEERVPVWTAPIGQADFLAGYTVRGLAKGRKLSFQLNILNVLDETDPIITRYDFVNGERRIRGLKPRDPLTWRFTTSFEF